MLCITQKGFGGNSVRQGKSVRPATGPSWEPMNLGGNLLLLIRTRNVPPEQVRLEFDTQV